MKLVSIALMLLLVTGCATYKPPTPPAGQETRAAFCRDSAKKQADDLPGERRAATLKARGSSVPLAVTLDVLDLLINPWKLPLIPPVLIVGAVQAKKTYAADYQAGYEACMSPCGTGFCASETAARPE